jgi:hypothetical protein
MTASCSISLKSSSSLIAPLTAVVFRLWLGCAAAYSDRATLSTSLPRNIGDVTSNERGPAGLVTGA